MPLRFCQIRPWRWLAWGWAWEACEPHATAAHGPSTTPHVGQFDHVTPPTPEPGTPGEFVNGQPIGLAYRVPCLVISPFSRGGYVCSTTFNHTSTLRLIEARFGVEIANLSKWRRETCGDLTAAFGFGAPAQLDVPPLPETEHALQIAEERAMSLLQPSVPAKQAMPRQEPGSRPRRA